MIIIDGLMDEPMDELSGQNSFGYARHPNIDDCFAGSRKQYIDACPHGYTPESMHCILNLLGVDRQYFPGSRASLELLAHGQVLQPDEVVLRCNLVQVEDGKLKAFNGGPLQAEEMAEISRQADRVSDDLTFYHLSGYRNLIVLKQKHFRTLQCATYPPHEHLGEDIDGLLAGILAESDLLAEFVARNQLPVNYLKDTGHDRKYIFYPWGLSWRNSVPLFRDLHGLTAAAVCGAEIVRGIALAMGMHVPAIRGLTADTDTDLTAKAKAAIRLLNEYDFVLVHINGTDEAAHRGNVHEKVRFIEQIDREFFGSLRNHLPDAVKVILCADHATSPVSRKHTALDVPYFVKDIKL